MMVVSTYPDSASHKEMHLHKNWVTAKEGGSITHSTCDNEDAKRKKKFWELLLPQKAGCVISFQ